MGSGICNSLCMFIYRRWKAFVLEIDFVVVVGRKGRRLLLRLSSVSSTSRSLIRFISCRISTWRSSTPVIRGTDIIHASPRRRDEDYVDRWRLLAEEVPITRRKKPDVCNSCHS